MRDDVKTKLLEINSLKLLLEEERNITSDYANEANLKVANLEHSHMMKKSELESKIALLDKQLRIRKCELLTYVFFSLFSFTIVHYIFSKS